MLLPGRRKVQAWQHTLTEWTCKSTLATNLRRFIIVKNTVARMGFWASESLAITVFFFGCSSGSGGNNLGGSHTSGGIGRPCDLTVDASSSQTVYNASASECPSQLCLKPVVQMSASITDPPTEAYCSASCSQDSDCDGELRDRANALDTRCKMGFTCGMPMVVGPLGCKKLCVCKDFLGSAGLPTPTTCLSETSSGTPTSGLAGVGQETDIYISVAPVRDLDLVFMIDNSPSMAPKQKKLNDNFPKLIEALKDPTDGTLPNLRVAIIDSDLGTGGAYQTGPCGPKTLPDGTISNYGDLGRFQMINAASCSVTSPDALWIEYSKGQPVNYKMDINPVFACLASGLGTLGCGEEHQLQAFEFALVLGGIGNDAQHAMVRPSAYLGLVFLSDEDDCSAATNDGMFQDLDSLKNESASLRCATRGHACIGRNLADVDPPNYPTDGAFSTPFTNCVARMGDECPNQTDNNALTDTSVPTTCNPLKSVHKLAENIKELKSNPDEQILVAGIFGWPLSDADMANARYRIDTVPNPNTADTSHPQLYEYWPVCYDPSHPAPKDGSYDANAFGSSATGGLRMSAFIDEFGANGLKFSICQSDFANSMKVIGDTIAKKLQNLCVDYKLLDKDIDPTNGLQPECRIVYQNPVPDPNNPKNITLKEGDPLPECSSQFSRSNPPPIDCWMLTTDKAKCPINGQLINVLRTAAEINAGPLTPGTKISMQCLTCPDGAANLDPNSDAYKACNY